MKAVLLFSLALFEVIKAEDNVFAGYMSPQDAKMEKFDNIIDRNDTEQTIDDSLGIIGGTDANTGEIPWQVSFQVYTRRGWFHFCGGSIVGSTKVATAAHCCSGMQGRYLRVFAGSTNLRDSRGSQSLYVSKYSIHPSYNSRNTNNDVCRLDLSGKFEFNDRVRSIKICRSEPSGGQYCDISGWGATRPNGSRPPSNLQKVCQQIVSRPNCQRVYGSRSVTENSVCIGGQKTNEGACVGDSGGPMACFHEGGNCLAGATSFGSVPCGQRGRPAVYSNLANFRSFFD